MNSSVDKFFSRYVEDFLAGNKAARGLADSLNATGVGLMPLVDHCTLRTLDVDERAKEAIDLGFRYDEDIGVLEFDKWWAKVYRKPGYPTLFIDQAFSGERGQESLIPAWVKAHGDQCFHHIAILVEDIETAMTAMKSRNIQFTREIVGERGTDLRQIFTQPEMRNGEVYSVLELIERHNGYAGFLPPQADGLMESTRR
jgi:catechol 2,3-dioxygenase-like lactoylglutathione lyase family enzyme